MVNYGDALDRLDEEFSLERDWTGVWLIAAISVGTIGIVTFAAGAHAEHGVHAIAGVALAVGLAGALAWIPLVQVLTQFRSSGIRRLTIRGWRLTRWAEVSEVTTRMGALDLSTSRGRLQINMRFFKKRRALLDLLAEQLRPEVVRHARDMGVLPPE
jgi:hypothetical protein